MQLERVTMTGADDSVDPKDLASLSTQFPFVEWGILLSASNQGGNRFPSMGWLAKLYEICRVSPAVTISLHVCGQWVREICRGNWTPLFTNVGPLLDVAKRVQLNFHAFQHSLTPGFLEAAKARCLEQGWQVIFQCDGVNDRLVGIVRDAGLDAVPLYDKSGGAGVVPNSWPLATEGVYSGYAGGLGPHNLESELPAISEAAGEERFWIDMETKVRTSSDRVFDLEVVRRCLGICCEAAGVEEGE